MLDVIICANFGVQKLRGLGNTRGQILEFPIEMAGSGHPYGGAENARLENAGPENGGTSKLWKAVAVENVQHS